MAFPWLIVAAIIGGSAAISYVMTQKAQKAAKKAADEMAGLLINKESNIEPIPVIYGVRRVGGVRVFVSTRDANGGDPNEFLYICLVLCEGDVHSITNIHLDDIPITDSRYSGLYEFNVHTGADDQAYDNLLTGANAGWTSTHRLRGVAYVAIKLKWDADVFSGVPEITALVNGRKVYDPRKDSTSAGYVTGGASNQRFATPSTWTFSENPSLCIRDYLSNARFGKGLAGAKLDDVAFGASATDCDTSVTFYNGGTVGKIFQTNAVLQTDDTLFDNIQKMLMGCRGFLPYNQGVYSLKIDKSASSVYAFTTDNLIGGISITGESKENKFNRVNVKFANPDLDYQPDTATWPDANSNEETAYLAEDNGTLLVSDMDLPTCTNYYVARDLARVILRRSRNALRASIQATSEALQLSVGDVVTVNHPTPNWGNKPFQVEEITLNYDGTCNLTLLEYDSSIYTYDTSAVQKSYPDTNLPDPFTVGTPGSLSLTATISVALDGTIVPQVNMSWGASTDSFVTQYDVQFSTVSQSNESSFTSIITDNLSYVITPVVPGATYYTRVRSVNSLGVRSAFVTANIGSIGDTTAPALPTSLGITAGYKSISLTWTNPADKDFSNVEVYRATSSGGTFAVVATVGGGWGAKAEFLNGGLADATAFFYKFKSVDYSGNKSAFTAEVTATTNAAAINGTPGQSTFTASVFIRASSQPSTPSGGSFNFGTNVLTAPGSWSITVPSGTTPVYQANFQFSISGDTGSVTAGNWSTPVILAENGDPGTNGLSTFVFSVYKRATSGPSTPSGGSYNFGTNAITAPSGWSASVPSGTDPIYVSTTTAQITGNTGTDSSLTWISPVLFVQNGGAGAAGPRNAAGYVYYSPSAASAPSSPSATSYNFSTGAFSGLTTNWSRTPPNVTGGDAHYWATSYYITEATLGGTQTLTFASPFSSVQFDGLVTFTNLNAELADASGDITTINGGLLTTGTINVAQVNISGTTQSNFNLQSAGSGERMKITNNTIEIYDANRLRVKLGNLS